MNNHDNQLNSIEHKNRKKIITKSSASNDTPRIHKRRKLVCIGTSTGGPRALQTVLTSLPESFPAPILVVQHMPAGFTNSLAKRLNNLSRISVKEAEDLESIESSVAYIAPGNFHMTVSKSGKQLVVSLEQTPPLNGHRPAVDKTLESLSQLRDYDIVVVIMTGMGQDGTKGLLELKRTQNVKVIAESKESCVVYGMPRSAIEANLVDEIKKIDEIGETILKYINE
ncbi:CheB methylesterase domain-containing protein [Heyndrickxia ginsengihumi]|uniref:protein-glutamate methylesterase n=1 Tax=Heyndrickxia ginsengihumi TaxID=363870 RepID=A0A6M0P593_9BACI|nr:CheB methylesterase domain-containing protein [Heyndrickxia ginsengihumi]MBE6182773.1 chemotaxis protein CheB [Bacillus sp. (in: firmicutes)]MCM3022513.1 CheB methylesterase domain-containing protein [Heyndrickxia ginsengihumi]NEY19633.1 chemotaxis protein CheB [Heyndrickxia ginsengihumi]